MIHTVPANTGALWNAVSLRIWTRLDNSTAMLHFHGLNVIHGDILSWEKLALVFRVLIMLDWLLHRALRKQYVLLFGHRCRENRWIHAFPWSSGTNWNANSFVRDLNSKIRFHSATITIALRGYIYGLSFLKKLNWILFNSLFIIEIFYTNFAREFYRRCILVHYNEVSVCSNLTSLTPFGWKVVDTPKD